MSHSTDGSEEEVRISLKRRGYDLYLGRLSDSMKE